MLALQTKPRAWDASGEIRNTLRDLVAEFGETDVRECFDELAPCAANHAAFREPILRLIVLLDSRQRNIDLECLKLAVGLSDTPMGEVGGWFDVSKQAISQRVCEIRDILRLPAAGRLLTDVERERYRLAQLRKNKRLP